MLLYPFVPVSNVISLLLVLYGLHLFNQRGVPHKMMVRHILNRIDMADRVSFESNGIPVLLVLQGLYIIQVPAKFIVGRINRMGGTVPGLTHDTPGLVMPQPVKFRGTCGPCIENRIRGEYSGTNLNFFL